MEPHPHPFVFAAHLRYTTGEHMKSLHLLLIIFIVFIPRLLVLGNSIIRSLENLRSLMIVDSLLQILALSALHIIVFRLIFHTFL